MEDKYKMTTEQNLFFAKRNIVDSIWKSSHIEGIDVTFPETQKIFDGGNIAHLSVDEIQIINNLKHAWLYVLNSIGTENDLNMLKSINSLVGNNLIYKPGEMRTYEVSIGGTSWKPEIPNVDSINSLLEKQKSIKCDTERAIKLMCELMRMQFFSDGNKRTATLFANKILIENGRGTIAVPVEKDVEFGQMLIEYYETNNIEKIANWIYDNALDGIKQ